MEKISKINKLKRFLALALLIIIALTIAGCAKNIGKDVSTSLSNNTESVIENVRIVSGAEQVDVGTVKPGESVTKDVPYFDDGKINVKYTINGFDFDSRLSPEYKGAHSVDIKYAADDNGINVFGVSSVKTIDFILGKINDWVWGIPLITLIILVGILLTVRSKGVQFLHLGKALKFMFKNEKDGEGEVSSFGALCTALSATIGTGNIVGVATAVCAGGPGALFWMEVAAIFGMATKYAEGLLAVKYREIDKNGKVLGGPFYYIEKGLGSKWKWLAILFAVFGVFVGLMGIGTMTQVQGIARAVQTFFDPNAQHTIALFGNHYSIATVIAGFVVTVCVALVIIGGLKRSSKVSQVVVPFMAILYIGFALILIICNITEIPAAIALIVKSAFTPTALAGGAVGTMFIAMQKGIARGIFSNEAGLGSAPIAAAAAKTNEPVRQGLVCMTGTFIDTIIVCTMTGLAIVLTGAWQVEGIEGAEVTIRAFSDGIPFLNATFSSFIVMVCLAFFAFTTILGWDYYSEKCLEYLVGGKKKVIMGYKILYIIAVFIGPYLTVSAVWTLADIVNGLMAFPNVIALVLLSGVVARETKDYITRYKKQKLK